MFYPYISLGIKRCSKFKTKFFLNFWVCMYVCKYLFIYSGSMSPIKCIHYTSEKFISTSTPKVISYLSKYCRPWFIFVSLIPIGIDWMLSPPKYIYWNLILRVMVFEGGTLGRWLGHDGCPLISEVSALIKETSERAHLFLLPREDTRNDLV